MLMPQLMAQRWLRQDLVLPEIIHFNQNAYVQGRTIFDAVRTIDILTISIKYMDC